MRKVNILLLICYFEIVIVKSYLTTSRGNITLTYKTNDSIKDDEEEEDGQQLDENRLVIDRPKEPEKVGGLGHDFGGSVGIGPADNVRCLMDRPRGEDNKFHCKLDSAETKNQRIKDASNLVVITANGTSTSAHKRLVRSALVYKYEIRALGETDFVDSELQLKLLRKAIDKINEEKYDKIVLFVDGPDVILQSGPLRVVEELENSEADVLVSSSGDYLGDKALKNEFPKVEKGHRYLNSGAFAGRVSSVKKLLDEYPLETNLESLLTKAYIDPVKRKEHNFRIDHLSNLFQNLNGAKADLELRFLSKESYVQNTVTKSIPVVLRAVEEDIVTLNTYGSYVARVWNEKDGCQECWEDMINLEDIPDANYPPLTLAVFIEKPTPFLEEFLFSITNLSYPKNKIHLFLHNGMELHTDEVDVWFEKVKKTYKSVRYIPSQDASTKEWHAKNSVIDYCLERECDYVFYVDADARLDNNFVLKLLIEQNRDVLAPMLFRPGKAWSNFWGSLTSDGFYARSDDYMDVVSSQRRGLWNVPYVANCLLIKRSVLENEKTRPSFINNLLDPDMAFCQNLRNKKVFIYVSNRVDFGHLVNSDTYNANNFNPDLWQLFDNRFDWEKRYLHQNYSLYLNETTPMITPCPDVYWFPIFTERYAQEMIDMMENYGQWSDGSNLDTRLEGGYETVPTVDIHMNQVAYNDEWLEILRAYVQPLQLRAFAGYYNDVGPPRALMSFAVRYKPDEQSFLRPHHDTATYTINVGLNRPNIDYQGGGVRFVRYNCSVLNTRVGWLLMHPGRLTHLHEGLTVTGGTRYIIVTFVDP